MNFPGRKVRAAEMADADVQRVIHREIEITVEREWTTVLYATQPPVSPPGNSVAEPEILPPSLPPANRQR